jgi:DedD protein
MAFFKFRNGGDEKSSAAIRPESIEAMRRRAKHRLIGAAVLVLLGVLGFPLLFDKQPRPISVDIPIEIPEKSKAKPLTIPQPVTAPAAQTQTAAAVTPDVPGKAQSAAPAADEKLAAATAALTIPETAKAVAIVESKLSGKPTEKPVLGVVRLVENTKAEVPPPSQAVARVAGANEGRFVVQVGAYSDVARAREVRLKVEHVGLKTYTQLVETKDGRRIRVRVGPFASKAEADKAAEKIKKLDLPAAILSL